MRRTTPRANAGGEKDNLQTSCFVISRSPVRIRATAPRELRGGNPAEDFAAKPDQGITASAILEARAPVARQAPANAARTPFGRAPSTLHKPSPGVVWPVDRSRRLSGQFNSSTPRLGMLYYKNRTAQGADLWAAAVVLAAEEDSWRHGERGNVALQAAAALVLACGDAWLVGGAP